MYRKRRRFQSYYGTSGRGFGGNFKFIIVAVFVLAVVSALITGAVLGDKARGSAVSSFKKHKLTDYGGVEKPTKDYLSLGELRAYFVSSANESKSAFADKAEKTEGNAVIFAANSPSDGEWLFVSNISEDSDITLSTSSQVSADDIVSAVHGEKKLVVACIFANSFSEKNEYQRLADAAEEAAVARELAEAGVDEIIVFSLPDDSDAGNAVGAYMANITSVCPRTNVTVAISKEQADTAGVTRLVSYTEGYADAYALDMREYDVNTLGKAIERGAYFITNYNMRLVLSDEDETKNAELVALAASYELESYLFFKN